MRRLSTRQEHPLRFCICFLAVNDRRICPHLARAFINRKPSVGECDRILKQVLPGQFPEALVHPIPTLHGAWNRDRVNAVLRHALHIVPGEKRWR